VEQAETSRAGVMAMLFILRFDCCICIVTKELCCLREAIFLSRWIGFLVVVRLPPDSLGTVSLQAFGF
jgi:hypothetical protein